MSNTDNKSIISNLSCDSVDTQCRNIDWQECLGEDMEGWRPYEAVECEECGFVHVLAVFGEERCCDIQCEIIDGEGDEIDNECEGYLYPSGPMMNHFYPCQLDDVEEAAKAIVHLPLCVIEFEDGETGFALTGGGMDLSWEICDAYISCGYLPPFQYCDLPGMADKERESRTQLILAACRSSAECLEDWANRRVNRLDEMTQRYKKSDAA